MHLNAKMCSNKYHTSTIYILSKCNIQHYSLALLLNHFFCLPCLYYDLSRLVRFAIHTYIYFSKDYFISDQSILTWTRRRLQYEEESLSLKRTLFFLATFFHPSDREGIFRELIYFTKLYDKYFTGLDQNWVTPQLSVSPWNTVF